MIVWIAALEGWVVERLGSWIPGAILQFAQTSTEGGVPSAGEIAAFSAIAFVFNGVVGPVTEELYFRGYLLPRIDRHGGWAPVLNSALFAVYHVWMPWRWPQIVIGFIPLAVAVRRTRSIYVSMIAHGTINVVFLIILMSSLFAA